MKGLYFHGSSKTNVDPAQSIFPLLLILGTFGDVEHVFIVGGAGGVPHYTDYYKHVRLGDVVMSTPNDKGHIYVFCDKVW